MHKFFANSLFIGKKLQYLPHCHSTNKVAAELLTKSNPPEGMVVLTENQTAGKGQRGNHWESEPGKNLTFSIILYPNLLLIKDQFYLNMIISLGVADALKTELGIDVKVKWPNDILVNDKKISGILIENALRSTAIEHAIVGIGLNVNQTMFPVEKATSMAELTLMNYDLNNVFNQVIQSIEKYYLLIRSGDLKRIKQAYLSNLYWINEVHLFESDGVFSGQIVDIDDGGKLVVESNQQRDAYDIKEISFLK